MIKFNKKKIVFAIITVTTITLLFCIFAEFAIRIHVLLTRGELALSPDPELGWAVKANFKSKRKIITFGRQKEYPVIITTNQYGFRKWGDIKTEKSKIFIVGDSFTHSMYASDNKTWYSIFAENTGAEVFTYGCSGYGTIQQYLVVKKFINQIEPDMLIIAFTNNDFDNNIDSGVRDPIEHAFGRPYFTGVDDQIKLKSSPITRFLCQYSHLAYFITTRIHMSSAFSISVSKFSPDEKLTKSIAETKKALQMLKKILPQKTVLIMFALSCEGQELENLLKLCSELNIECIHGVDDKIKNADQGKKLMRAADGSHLNEDGEKIVGEWLSKWYNEK